MSLSKVCTECESFRVIGSAYSPKLLKSLNKLPILWYTQASKALSYRPWNGQWMIVGQVALFTKPFYFPRFCFFMQWMMYQDAFHPSLVSIMK